jgi:hypothetical protein
MKKRSYQNLHIIRRYTYYNIQSLRARTNTVHETGPRSLPSTSFQIHYLLINIPFDATSPNSLTVPLNKP